MTQTEPRHNVVELPEAPARRTRRRVLWWAGGVLAAIVVLVCVLLYSPLLAIKTIALEGNRLAPTAEVTRSLRPLLGVPLPQVGPARVERLLADQPAIEAVVVQAETPSTLHVRITERHPVAVLKRGGTFALIDGEGRRLSTLKKRGNAKLPLVDAAALGGGQEVLATVTAVLDSLPQSVLSRLESAGAKTVDSVELKLTDGRSVLWGNAERSADKAAVLEALLGVKPPEGQPAPKTIDVTSPDQPVTR